MNDLFNLAVSLARQEGAATLAKVAIKSIAMKSYRNRGEVCGCSSYDFPHRMGSGKCPGVNQEMTREERDQQMLADFDRIEANAINRGM